MSRLFHFDHLCNIILCLEQTISVLFAFYKFWIMCLFWFITGRWFACQLLLHRQESQCTCYFCSSGLSIELPCGFIKFHHITIELKLQRSSISERLMLIWWCIVCFISGKMLSRLLPFHLYICHDNCKAFSFLALTCWTLALSLCLFRRLWETFQVYIAVLIVVRLWSSNFQIWVVILLACYIVIG